MILEFDKMMSYIKASHIPGTYRLKSEKKGCLSDRRNGAVKTTTLRSVMGFLILSRAASVHGQDIVGIAPYKIAWWHWYAPKMRILGSRNLRYWIATWIGDLRTPEERVKLAYSVFPKLEDIGRKGTDQGGERKISLFARALALRFRLFLLMNASKDFPCDHTPDATEIHEIAKMGNSILIVESIIYQFPIFTDRLYVIEKENIFQGNLRTQRWQVCLKIVAGSAWYTLLTPMIWTIHFNCQNHRKKMKRGMLFKLF